MRFHTFLLKYGEIGIKGKNRYLFEDALVRQVRYALKDVDGNFDVHKSQARIYVDCEGDYDYEDTVEHLKECSDWSESARLSVWRIKVSRN